MSNVAREVIGGVNQLIKEQRNLSSDDKVEVTMAMFDTAYDLLCVRTPIEKVEELTSSIYFARGMTALYDAIAKTASQLDKQLDGVTIAQKDGDTGDRVMFVIWTDGHENSSQEVTSKEAIKKIIDDYDAKGWNFLYYGAGKDAWQAGYELTANSVGTVRNNAATNASASAGLSGTVGAYRSSSKAKLDATDIQSLQTDIDDKLKGWKQ